MTLENSLKLYEHFVSSGMKKEAADMKANLERRGHKFSKPKKD